MINSTSSPLRYSRELYLHGSAKYIVSQQ